MVELVMRVSLLLLLTVLTAPAKSINPAVKRIVNAVSEERIAAIEKKLESFETRSILFRSGQPQAWNRRSPPLDFRAVSKLQPTARR